MSLLNLINAVNDFIWGLLVDWILYVGIFFSLGLQFLPLRLLPFAIVQAWRGHADRDGDGTISATAALMTTLGGNIGAGSLAGIALMLIGGGPGSLFWMWVATVLGLAIKFAESALAVRFRSRNARGEWVGGPMYYIANGLPPSLRWLAIGFALIGTLATFGKGNAVQVMELAETLDRLAGVPPLLTGGVMAVLTLWTLNGGIVRISRVSTILVPLMVLGYLSASAVMLSQERAALGQAIGAVFQQAFSGQAMAGGTLFVVISNGIKRAVFAQEIGMGTAPIAMAVARPPDPLIQGTVATLGGLTTALVGTMTALLLLCRGGLDAQSAGAQPDPIALLESAFNPGQNGPNLVIGLTTLLFAFTTIVVFGYYGERCLEYLLGSRSNSLFRRVWAASVVLTSVKNLDTIWSYTTTLNALLVLPNLLALVLLSGTVFQLAKRDAPTAG